MRGMQSAMAARSRSTSAAARIFIRVRCGVNASTLGHVRDMKAVTKACEAREDTHHRVNEAHDETQSGMLASGTHSEVQLSSASSNDKAGVGHLYHQYRFRFSLLPTLSLHQTFEKMLEGFLIRMFRVLLSGLLGNRGFRVCWNMVRNYSNKRIVLLLPQQVLGTLF